MASQTLHLVQVGRATPYIKTIQRTEAYVLILRSKRTERNIAYVNEFHYNKQSRSFTLTLWSIRDSSIHAMYWKIWPQEIKTLSNLNLGKNSILRAWRTTCVPWRTSYFTAIELKFCWLTWISVQNYHSLTVLKEPPSTQGYN